MKRTWKNLTAHPVVASATGVVLLIGTIGGAAWTLGPPPWANLHWTEDQVAGLQVQIYQQREDQLERRIFEIKVEKSKWQGKWPPIMEEELQRLQRELDDLKDQKRGLQKK